jgi:hypothetical protein
MTQKIWITSENSHIFGLWLQSRMDLFRNYPYSHNFYKKAFNSLERNWISSSSDIAYDLFVSELCKNI